MNGKIIFSICVLLTLVGSRSFSQQADLDVEKMRADAIRASIQDPKWYDIVDIKKTDDAFEIYYDIIGSEDDQYDVSLTLLRASDPAFRLVPAHVSGKIGTGSFAGKNNVIIWQYKSDLLSDLKGNDYRFELAVQKINKSSFPWLWVGAGVAAGGVAAILLLSGNKNSTPAAAAIPAITVTRPN
jgi:hypothetical protein